MLLAHSIETLYFKFKVPKIKKPLTLVRGSSWLFPASFKAWQYGPILNKIYAKDKDNSITPSLEKKHCTTKMEKDVWAFIDDIITQINPTNDFGLVARSHQDKAWQDAYHAGENHCKMNEKDIIRDYQKYIRESNSA